MDWRQLQPARDTDAALTVTLKAQLRPEDAKDLSSFDFLVEEAAGPQFLTDDKIARLRRYRVTTKSATWFYTFLLASDSSFISRRVEPDLP